MNDKHWAIFALRDIQNALDREKYDIAAYHIDDAIHAIIAMDEQSANEDQQENDACSGQAARRL